MTIQTRTGEREHNESRGSRGRDEAGRRKPLRDSQTVLVEYAKEFVTFVGSSVGAFTALFYAAGYIAETSRWTYLGNTPFVMPTQLYLRTGAEFFVLILPCLFEGVVVLLGRHLLPCLAILLAFGVVAFTGHKSTRRNGALLAAEVLLLGLASYLLLFTPTSFVGPPKSSPHHLSLMDRDLLLRPEFVPPRASILRANYSLLLCKYVLMLVAACAVYLAHREARTPEARGRGGGSGKTSGLKWIRWLKDRWSRLSGTSRLWDSVHRCAFIVLGAFLVVMGLLLPINFAQLLIHGPFSVVTLPSEATMRLKQQSTVFLLREDAERYLFYVRDAENTEAMMWPANKSDIHDIHVIGNRKLWR